MERISASRFFIVLLQHIMAICIFLMIGTMVVNSTIITENMYGEKTGYSINPFNAANNFEDSTIFKDVLVNAIEDITRLSVIKSQLETDGIFDPEKEINVTEFVNLLENKSDSKVTAFYSVENIVKWSRYGTIMQEVRFQSKIDFILYFGLGFVEKMSVEEYGSYYTNYMQSNLDEQEEYFLLQALSESRINELYKFLTDTIFTESGKEVTLILDEEKKEIISLEMLVCRYDTTDGKKLVDIATSWSEYCKLEKNVIDSILTLGTNYEHYQNRNDIYMQESSNLQFLIKTKIKEREEVYSNLPIEVITEDSGELNNYFINLGKYIIYLPSTLSYQTNTELTEDDLFKKIMGDEYSFPENSEIWIGVDTKFPISNDVFALANTTYDNIVPYIIQIIIIIIICVIVWLIIFGYYTITSGISKETGEKYIHTIDKIFTEIFIIIIILGIIFFIRSEAYLEEIVNYNIYNRYSLKRIEESIQSKRYLVGMIAAFGFMGSVFFTTIWYSLVRRVRNNIIWKNSVCSKIYKFFEEIFTIFLQNKNSVINTFLPYNLYLIFNLILLVVFFQSYQNLEENLIITRGIVAVIILFNTVVGVSIFRRSKERKDIIDAIIRIKEGDIHYKIDEEELHGENIELAKAVNNIGDGIRIAVETSMKDERMKADLITNVSHDIKTPLTSIISYVDLIKNEKNIEEPIKSYIDVLDIKTQRLKQLTDDLVEASRISSGNIVFEYDVIDFIELIKQSVGEFSEKFDKTNLQVVVSTNLEKALVYVDSRRIWRVMENLFNNASKYALENTRIYIDIEKSEKDIEISIKNISRTSLNITPDELTERFIRGDSARTTEGSGLGLSIAKNLVEAQNGKFSIILDGDLFKIVFSFEEYKEKKLI